MKNFNPFETTHAVIKGFARIISTGQSNSWQALTKNTLIAVWLIVTALFFCMADLSCAEAVLPEYERLSDLVFPGRPSRASVDASGNIYLIDAAKPFVTKYSPFGVFLKNIPLSSAPTAIKAADNGLLYIGLKDKIEIYDGTTLLKTVEGVSRPVAIDVASSGAIYAVDEKHHCVKIISPSGGITVLGDHNTFGSDLRDLVLDETNQEFYVLDRNERFSAIYVWRVQVFDLNGNFIRRFSRYGIGLEGKLLSASSLAVDQQRRVFVADNVQNVIGVFDYAGNYLGSLYDTANPYYNPVDMVHGNNRLFILSFLGHKGTVLGFEGYADLALLPDKMDLKVQGSYVSGDRTVTLSSTGSGDLHWKAASDAGWLGLSKTSGSIGGSLSDQTDVTVNTSGLEVGKHMGTITVAFNGGSSYLGVTVDVLTLPELSVSPEGMAVQAVAGTGVARQASIALNNDLSGALAWTALPDCSWLSISPASGISNALTPATVTINSSGLAPGIYTGKIVLAVEGMEGSASAISVTLAVVSDNKIQVATNNENAHFSISGPQSFSGSGSSWSVGNIADGSYTITYEEVQGWKTPRPETQTVAGGSTIIFTGNYEEIRPESIIVTLDGIMDTTDVKIFDMNGSVNEFVAFNGERGGLVTAVGDLNGDGVNEIAATVRHGDSRVGVFDRSGRQMAEFAAFTGNGMYDIITADLDGDGSAELIVSRSWIVPVIRVLSFNNGTVSDTGINFRPFENGSNLLVGAGDIDGDGAAEIVTVQAVGRTVLLRVWAPDESNIPGNWSISLKNEISLDVTPRVLTNIAVKPTGNNGAADVLIMRNDGSLLIVGPDGIVRELSVAARVLTDMEAGDVNGDGNIEIITGLRSGTVRVFTLNGAEITSITAFKTGSEVRVSTGDLGY